VFLIIPGAYVSIDTIEFESKSSLARFMISAAGSWHNLIFGFLSFSILKRFGLFFMVFFDRATDGVLLLSTVDGNGITSYPNMIITHINDEPIIGGIKGYETVIEKLILPIAGPFRCTNSTSKSLTCCQSQIVEQNPLQCLWDFQSIYNYATIPQLQSTNVVPQMCMDLTDAFLNGNRCTSNQDCDGICVGPFHTGSERFIHLRLEQIFDKGDSYQLNLVGNPVELHAALLVYDFIPKSRWVSTWIPFYIEILLRYICSLNIALGIFNMIPAFQLDGISAWKALVSILCNTGLRIPTKPWIFFNTIALTILVLCGIVSVFLI
jgi:membrane-associated protease RseP (regulator of RpoE activity)